MIPERFFSIAFCSAAFSSDSALAFASYSALILAVSLAFASASALALASYAAFSFYYWAYFAAASAFCFYSTWESCSGSGYFY